MRIDKKNVFLLVIALLFIAFIVKDFSYTRNVEKTYYGILYAEENGSLRELESGTVRMKGTLSHSRRNERIKGTLNIAIGECAGQIPFATHANFYDRNLKWYNALLTNGELNYDPVEIGGYTSSTLCFARNLSAIGMLLESDGNRFFLVAAKEKEGLPDAESAVLESIYGG